MSQHPVSPWADVKEVFDTAARPLPETYPLGRLAFIKQSNVFNDADFFRKSASYVPHIIYLFPAANVLQLQKKTHI
jgi:hypothetical protein